jgi:hypothetical protein
MSKMKYALAMLAAAGTAGGAARASTIVTELLDIPITGDINTPGVVPISLAGKGAPQFYYFTETTTDSGSGDTLQTGVIFQANATNITPFANSAIGLKTATPGLPANGESYFPNNSPPGAPLAIVYKTDNGVSELTQFGFPATPGDIYLHVLFDPAGATYKGSFKIDAAGTLDSIIYTAVPEPDAWALLIAGSAMAGAALRTRRRGQAASIA